MIATEHKHFALAEFIRQTLRKIDPSFRVDEVERPELIFANDLSTWYSTVGEPVRYATVTPLLPRFPTAGSQLALHDRPREMIDRFMVQVWYQMHVPARGTRSAVYEETSQKVWNRIIGGADGLFWALASASDLDDYTRELTPSDVCGLLLKGVPEGVEGEILWPLTSSVDALRTGEGFAHYAALSVEVTG